MTARTLGQPDAARVERRERRRLLGRLTEDLYVHLVDRAAREVEQSDGETLAGILAFAASLLPPDPALGLPGPPFMGSLGAAVDWGAAPWC